MSLRNKSLIEIMNKLEPADVGTNQASSELESEGKPTLGPNLASAPSSTTLNTIGSNTNIANTEFIPYLFYCLHQIRKDQSNSANKFELQVGFIKHRLRSCKTFIETDQVFKDLMSKSIEDWNEEIQNRECELQRKKEVINNLRSTIDSILNK
ncbi:hypothetical protein TPHA_0H02140 [Tetrapisispora phaffii CBS 4417]|uniref:Mediator of RNA polymerase II transcription subunit 9 n=1 Tax=Tetrapisispora phaffii (strain ATCC 24235 / CBS 4417 / NBRC 1672 / NRRL Y-8282 / UCD 70-5) TaxID=1071381 RepID=G8BWG7_TETPH|nr:hypothetical protein TPHA_0H02140 [Tetrapisispora phaffii CBS 4417]CCE64418.1 hypothetical protein TPHA_0H02140 [Tetrapisispora phaffii CBS 4417]